MFKIGCMWLYFTAFLCGVCVCVSPSNLSAIPGALEYVTRVSEPGSRNRVMLGLSLSLFGSTN